MRRTIAIAFLALGTVFGYASGIAHLVRAHHAHCWAQESADGPGRPTR
jgi:hypothetical protein